MSPGCSAAGTPRWPLCATSRWPGHRGRCAAGSRWAATIIGGRAVVEVALIAGAAFAVSVRRRQRELGMLAAVGGSRRHVRGVVLLTGAAAGVVGSVVGVAVAWLAVVAGMPWFRSISERALDGPQFDVPWIVGLALLGVVLVVLGAGLASPWLLEQLGRLRHGCRSAHGWRCATRRGSGPATGRS